MSENREAELLAQVDLLAAKEVENHHGVSRSNNKILKGLFVAMFIAAVTQPFVIQKMLQDEVTHQALRNAQTLTHRGIWLAENVGAKNASYGNTVVKTKYFKKAEKVVAIPGFRWDMSFRHPLNPGKTFEEFALGADHPFARALACHLLSKGEDANSFTYTNEGEK
jgi:hypothetical protein